MSSPIQIQECKTAAERLKFIQFWWVPYKGNPYWVPPLVNERHRVSRPGQNPYFQHGRAAYFLATRRRRAGRHDLRAHQRPAQRVSRRKHWLFWLF